MMLLDGILIVTEALSLWCMIHKAVLIYDNWPGFTPYHPIPPNPPPPINNGCPTVGAPIGTFFDLSTMSSPPIPWANSTGAPEYQELAVSVAGGQVWVPLINSMMVQVGSTEYCQNTVMSWNLYNPVTRKFMCNKGQADMNYTNQFSPYFPYSYNAPFPGS